MKKNEKSFNFVIIVVTLIFAILTSSITYAKLTAKRDATLKGTVQKWDISAGDFESNFNLFAISEIYDTNGMNISSPVVDSDVANGTTKAIIAPGTWGKCSFAITNSSQMAAKYNITYTVDEKGAFLQWSTNGSTWTDNLANITNSNIAINGTNNHTIYWKWDFGTNSVATTQTDDLDTAAGKSKQSPSINIQMRVIQNQI